MWLRAFVRYHGMRHPRELGVAEVQAFLAYLARERKTSGSTRNQALAALQFVYRDVLESPLPSINGVERVKQPVRLPGILSRESVHRVLGEMSGTPRLMASLLYGSGLRLLECCRLRIKDVDLVRQEICVRTKKGAKDRVTMLPGSLVEPLAAQAERVRILMQRRLARGGGFVELPGDFRKKAHGASRQLAWMWYFPAVREYWCASAVQRRTHHVHPSVLQRAVPQAAERAGVTQRVTCHTFRHCFATHLLESGYDIRTVQELLGHRDVSTTMIYTHVLNRGGRGVRSPLDVDPIGAALGARGN
jgi:integron integrase